jgi:hypothetical protein
MMAPPLTRRAWVGTAAAAAVGFLFLPRFLRAAPAGTPMVVYKDPNCGCCHNWVEIMKQSGFEVSVRDTANMAAIKTRYMVPAKAGSCHTAIVGGYVVEGHVPADLIRKVLAEKPPVVGLAVPGMPMGSPGMEGPRKDAYDVLTFDRMGKTAVYARR